MIVNELDPVARRVGPMLALLGGSPVLGEDFSGAGELKISVNGSAWTTPTGSVVEIGDGYYYYQASAADCASLGWIEIKISGVCDEFSIREDVEAIANGLVVGVPAPSGPIFAMLGGSPVLGEDFAGAGELEVSINGAPWANHLGTVTEIGNGYYYYTPLVGEVATVGWIAIKAAIVCDEFTVREDIVIAGETVDFEAPPIAAPPDPPREGWGADAWGTDEYGSLPETLSIVRAYAVSTNELIVVLNKPPLNVSGFVAGDVTHGGSWEVTLPDTNEVLQIAGVVSRQAPLEWSIRTLQRFPDTTRMVRIRATGLLDAAYHIIGPPTYFDFAGVTEVVSPLTPPALTRRPKARDLASLPAPVIDETTVGGTLQIKGGDYSLMDGPPLYKKLIIRRLIATPGDFYHLPHYGAGLRVKEPIVGGIVGLKATIEREISKERDLKQISVSLVQDQNSLTTKVSAVVSSIGSRITTTLQTR